MTVEDDAYASLDSWDARIDWALGRAGVVLDQATAQFLAMTLDSDAAESAATLAEAWTDLAETWAQRQSHELELAGALDDEDDEPEPERVRHRAR